MVIHVTMMKLFYEKKNHHMLHLTIFLKIDLSPWQKSDKFPRLEKLLK